MDADDVQVGIQVTPEGPRAAMITILYYAAARYRTNWALEQIEVYDV